ncbi:ATP/GTP-binding protein [Streptomyces sp. NBC_00237]|uniref:ATP/GTP-binding protein n=1 Tax=Streptomyces sp. NBC_00237 TaxID=2975687 RepID=UPI00224F0701|nr:ATP/GTP-binding protein [Streptomyces sp. NBC_00237]MCX5203871.1 ATP/GTP-binding protein [Streptomyces sp. NBC_00237]
MNTGDRHEARDTRTGSVPRPAGPPPAHLPPVPAAAPPLSRTEDWLTKARPAAGAGIWRYGHVPRADRPDEEEVGDRSLLVGAVISLLSGLLLWSLWRNAYIPYQLVPLKLFTPGEWWNFGMFGGARTAEAAEAVVIYNGLVGAALVYWFGRLGNWSEVFRRFVSSRPQPGRALTALGLAAIVQVLTWSRTLLVVDPVFLLLPEEWLQPDAAGDVTRAMTVSYFLYAVITLALLWPFARMGGWLGLLRRTKTPDPVAPAHPTADPARWPELRAAGEREAAERLTAEVRGGRMSDLDVVRVRAVWDTVGDDPARRERFAATVLRDGAAAFAHPSGDRDLPRRTARHDLLAGQVRIGRYVDAEPNPYRWRGVGVALEPAVLGTSLLAVGPPGTGKTRRLTAPVVESLALQALAGTCAVLAVCAAGTPLGEDAAYDVVVRIGDPASVHDLDLYGGTTDVEAASAVLAEALVGDLDAVDTGRAATALAQLIGPHHVVHGRFPAVPELYELLRADPAALQRLAGDLDAAGEAAMLRDLSSRVRQMGTAADPCPALADRLALLDRPAFSDFFATDPAARPFSLRALQHHPMRVRVELPEQGHAEASRLLARLVLAQFLTAVTARADRSLFACLVLDDATATLTADTVRGIGRLRSANAGVVLNLRTVDDVPEALHIPLLGAVGCHMAFSGVTTWDGRRFTEAWGTEWVETTEVAQHTVFANQPFTRAVHALRKLVTGKAVVTRAVTVKKVERERWSASELARGVPAGHAVLSLTTVGGEHAPPLLVDLRE